MFQQNPLAGKTHPDIIMDALMVTRYLKFQTFLCFYTAVAQIIHDFSSAAVSDILPSEPEFFEAGRLFFAIIMKTVI